jgi:hypothetical protein
MKTYTYLILFLLLLKTASSKAIGADYGPNSVNPVISGKNKMYVLIPGKDSLLLTSTNISVTGWQITKAPALGTAALTGADTRQVWVKYEILTGVHGTDTLTVEATASDGAASSRTIYITRYDNYYQYHGEILLDKIRLEFYNGQSGLYAESIRSNGSFIQGISYLWPASHLMRAFKNGNRINPSKYGTVLKSYTSSIDRYKSTANSKIGYAAYPGESGRFYDDNGLLIIQFAEIYKDLKDNRILDQAKIAYQFNNDDRDGNWGLPQHENQHGQGMFYSMAVNQTGLGAASLYELTGNEIYLEEAKSYYAQLMNPQVKLRDSNYHLFHQYTFYKNGQWSYSGTLDGQVVNGQGFRAYQTTHVIQIALKLYQATTDTKYLTEAQEMMGKCVNYWYRENLGLNENSFWGGDDMIDALIDCYEVTGEKEYFYIARNIIDFVIEFGKDSKGYYPGDYDDNFGKWNLDRRDEFPASFILMGQAAAASGILRVADAQSGIGTGIDSFVHGRSNPDHPLVFPNIIQPGIPVTIQFSETPDQPVQIFLYALNGSLVFKKEISLQSNFVTLALPVTAYYDGTLIMKIVNGSRVSSSRLVILGDVW